MATKRKSYEYVIPAEACNCPLRGKYLQAKTFKGLARRSSGQGKRAVTRYHAPAIDVSKR